MRDREDLHAQEAAVTAARHQLADALDTLATAAKRAHLAARTKRGQPDLVPVSAAHHAVTRAGEALDIATWDLHTAGGGDG